MNNEYTTLPQLLDHLMKKLPMTILLAGDLGTGKTYFVQQLAKRLNITKPITSPTFSILQTYSIPHNPTFKELHHFDFYRLTDLSADHLPEIGYTEAVADPQILTCLEWDKYIPPAYRPVNYIQITISLTANQERLYKIKSY